MTPYVSLSHAPYDGAARPTHIAGDSSGILWTDSATLRAVPSPGSASVTLLGGLQSPADLVLTRDGLLVVEAGSLSSTLGYPVTLRTGQIRLLPRAGGAALFQVMGLDAPSAAVVDASGLYWAEAWRVGTASRPAGRASTLASGVSDPLPRLAASARGLLVADGPFLKVLPFRGGNAERLGYIVDVDGGPAMPHRAADLVADGTDAFVAFLDPQFGPATRRIPLGGEAVSDYAQPFLTIPQDCVARIAVDAAYIYWTTGPSVATEFASDCAIVKAPRAGGAASVLVASGVRDFALVGGDVLFTTASTMSVDQSGSHVTGSTGVTRMSVDGTVVGSRPMAGFPSLMTADATTFACVETRYVPGGALWWGPSALTADPLATGPAPYEPPGYLWVDDLVTDGSAIYFTDIASGNIAALSPSP